MWCHLGLNTRAVCLRGCRPLTSRLRVRLDSSRFISKVTFVQSTFSFSATFPFPQAWHRNVKWEISTTEVGDTACHLCPSYCFKLIVARRLSTSSEVQFDLSADGLKGFNCKEQRHDKKSVCRLDGSLSADKLKVMIAVGLELHGWWQLSTQGVLQKKEKTIKDFSSVHNGFSWHCQGFSFSPSWPFIPPHFVAPACSWASFLH